MAKITPADSKSKTPRRSRNSERELAMRNQHWPKLNPKKLWKYYDEEGSYTSIPRTMPLILQPMDEMSNGKTVSGTYLDIWRRDFHHHGLAVIVNPPRFTRSTAFCKGGERHQHRFGSFWKVRRKRAGCVPDCASVRSLRFQSSAFAL